VPAHPGSPRKRVVKWVCVCVCACVRACVRACVVDFNEARDDGVLGWQCRWLDHTQTTCTSLQTDNHANTSSLIIFVDLMLLLMPNQHCQITEGWKLRGRIIRTASCCIGYGSCAQWYAVICFSYQQSYLTSGLVNTGMGDRLRAGILSHCAASQLGQLSFAFTGALLG